MKSAKKKGGRPKGWILTERNESRIEEIVNKYKNGVAGMDLVLDTIIKIFKRKIK